MKPSHLRVAHRYLIAISEGSEKRDLEKLVKKFLDLLNPHLVKPVSVRDVSLKVEKNNDRLYRGGRSLVWELSLKIGNFPIHVETTPLGKWRRQRVSILFM